jgi:threonine dehydratase
MKPVKPVIPVKDRDRTKFEPEDVAAEVMKAETRIRPHIRHTFLDYSPTLSELTGAEVYCKLENLQYTGSFKLRGALNKILSLSEEQIDVGVVTASTGNHAAAVAYCLAGLNRSGIIFMPENTPEVKVEAIKRLGGKIRYHGTDNADTEIFARREAGKHGMTYISPYNDPMVIAGQGTIGLELEEDVDSFDALFAAVGGGGLISGIAGFIKSRRPDTAIIGCSPLNSQVMARSVEAGKVLDIPSLPTISEGTTGGLEPGCITFELCRQLVDEFVTVSEEEIKKSLLSFIQNHNLLIEGAAAVPVAALLKVSERFRGQRVVVIICGANISLATLSDLLRQ